MIVKICRAFKLDMASAMAAYELGRDVFAAWLRENVFDAEDVEEELASVR